MINEPKVLIQSIGGEYRPQAIVPVFDDDNDVDGTGDGDYFVCPTHQDHILFVMGSNFWQGAGGTPSLGYSTVTVTGFCKACRKHYQIICGSYGG